MSIFGNWQTRMSKDEKWQCPCCKETKSVQDWRNLSGSRRFAYEPDSKWFETPRQVMTNEHTALRDVEICVPCWNDMSAAYGRRFIGIYATI